jgi:hypothetical protein
MVTEAVPRDVAAEQAVLSGCMWTPALIPTVAAIVTGEDFWTGPHQAIWGAVLALHQLGVPADPVLLMDHMRAEGATVDGPYLHTLYAVAPAESAVAYQARIVADCGTRRRMIQAGTRIAQRAGQPDVDIAELTEWSAAQVRAVRDERASVQVLSSGVDEFMRSTPEDVDWVVPGLLARADRFVLTGSGGLGKSTMLAQIAVCAAAGIDPLDWSAGEGFDPVRVTIIDCENADHQLKTRLWPMLREARDAGHPVEDRLRIGGHGNPLNLLDPSSALSLLRTVEHDKSDLVYIGPVYKLHNDDPDKEVVVKKITAVLDQIRALGCAIITEAHHTKGAKVGGSLEPSGSNLWTWWPEFGRGLRMDRDSDEHVRRCALENWRIDRVQRQWPDWIEHGGRWPWARSKTNPYYGANVA